MEQVRKGDPITATWANSIVNCLNIKTVSTQGQAGGVFGVAGCGYNSAPLAGSFELASIESDAPGALTGTIRGGVVFDMTLPAGTSDDARMMEVADYQDTFSDGDKVYLVLHSNEEEEQAGTVLTNAYLAKEADGAAVHNIQVGAFETSAAGRLFFRNNGVKFWIWTGTSGGSEYEAGTSIRFDRTSLATIINAELVAGSSGSSEQAVDILIPPNQNDRYGIRGLLAGQNITLEEVEGSIRINSIYSPGPTPPGPAGSEYTMIERAGAQSEKSVDLVLQKDGADASVIHITVGDGLRITV